jgi:phytoene dehydrogenase-like protein
MRQTHTVIVVGAGAGGLASAISAAAAGFDVTVVERSNTPGGKMRQLSAGGRPVDAGPTVLTMRWVFEQLFALAGADLGARIGLKQARLLARHGWRDGARLDLFADIEDSARAIADFSDRENAEGYRRFAADSAAMFSTLKPSYINAQRPGPLALVKRIGLFNLGDQLALKPLSSMWSALGSYFSDPRLQQLFGRYATYCGSSPFHGSGHTDAGRPCRTGWHLAGRWRHARGGTRHGTAGRGSGCAHSLWQRRRANRHKQRTGRGRDLGGGREACCRQRHLQRRRLRACRIDRRSRQCRHRKNPASGTVAFSRHLRHDRQNQRLPPCPPQRVLL